MNESKHPPSQQRPYRSGQIASGFPQLSPRRFTVGLVEVGSQCSGNPRLAHAPAKRCASTSALMSETKRSTSQISSNSDSSSGVNPPSWFRSINSCARAAACSEGRNAMISSAAGRRARNEMTSRRKLELPNQLRRNPRKIISPRRSRSAPNCPANWSGMSMVNCTALSLVDIGSSVKPHLDLAKPRSPGATGRRSMLVLTCSSTNPGLTPPPHDSAFT